MYTLPNIFRILNSRMMRWAGNIPHIGQKRNADKDLVGKAEKKRLL
jgi:hypothetical protein